MPSTAAAVAIPVYGTIVSFVSAEFDDNKDVGEDEDDDEAAKKAEALDSRAVYDAPGMIRATLSEFDFDDGEEPPLTDAEGLPLLLVLDFAAALAAFFSARRSKSNDDVSDDCWA